MAPKDEELLEQRVEEGFFSSEEAELIKAEADRFEEEIAAKGPWWDLAWKDWTPDPDWAKPTLPKDWATYAPS